MIVDPGRGRKRRARPLLHLVPNMFTVLGLCAGMTGMRYALDGRWELAVGLIIAAVIFDGLDGRSARLLKIESKLGEQLDSLADFLSFGVAPAVVVYLWILHDVRAIGWALAMLFATCCAMRLARFNVEHDDPGNPAWMAHFFSGIPAPAAAGMALLPMIASFVMGDDIARSWWLNAGVMLLVAVMMVSRVPTYSIKKLRIQPSYVMPTLIGVGMSLVFLATEPWATLLVFGLIYFTALPVAAWHARHLASLPTGHNAADTADGDDGVGEDEQHEISSSEPDSDRIVAIDKRAKR